MGREAAAEPEAEGGMRLEGRRGERGEPPSPESIAWNAPGVTPSLGNGMTWMEFTEIAGEIAGKAGDGMGGGGSGADGGGDGGDGGGGKGGAGKGGGGASGRRGIGGGNGGVCRGARGGGGGGGDGGQVEGDGGHESFSLCTRARARSMTRAKSMVATMAMSGNLSTPRRAEWKRSTMASAVGTGVRRAMRRRNPLEATRYPL